MNSLIDYRPALARAASALLAAGVLSYTTTAAAAFQYRHYSAGLVSLPVVSQQEPRFALMADVASLDFGVVAVGSSLEHQVVLSNTGNQPITLTSVTGPAGYVISGEWGVLPPGAQRMLTVTFTPTAAQSYAGTLTFNMTGGAAAPNITLTAAGQHVIAGTGVKLVSAQVLGLTVGPAGSLVYLTGNNLVRINGVNQTTVLSNKAPAVPASCLSLNSLTSLAYSPSSSTYYLGGSCMASSGTSRAALWSVATLGTTPTALATWGSSTNNNSLDSFAVTGSRLYMSYLTVAGVYASVGYTPTTGGAFSSFDAMGATSGISVAFNADTSINTVYGLNLSNNLVKYNGVAWSTLTASALTGVASYKPANSLAVASDGTLYLFNSANTSLHKFTASGSLIQSWALSNVQAYNGASALVLVGDVPYVSNNYGVWRID